MPGRCLCIAWCLAIATAPPAWSAPERPNVLVIFADDQGAVDLNCYGAKDLSTPAIDGLAERGLRFTQFYSAAPVCSPSRAGLLTGRYPWRVGVANNAGPAPQENINDLSESTDNPRLAGDAVTMAEVFGAAGYRTAHIGKWHLGHGPASRPLSQGFGYSFGHLGGCIDNYTHFTYWNGPNRHDLWENNTRVRMPGRFFPDLMVDKATEVIQAESDQPFFMYFASNMPHYPYQGDTKWLDYYAGLPYPRNLYAAFVSTLDDRVARLLKAIDDAGKREDTIVLYQSDNGHSREMRAHLGGGSAGPYRGEKFSLFEGGIRLPAVVSWPSQLPRGETRGQVVHACDWAPTLYELCGVAPPAAPIEGKSVAGVLKSADASSPHAAGDLHWDLGKQWAIRRGPWKLIYRVSLHDKQSLSAEDAEWFLSNVELDPSEKQNYASDEPGVVADLRARHEAMRAATE